MIEKHRVVFFVADGIQALDLFGPLEAFAAANELAGNYYDICLCGAEKGHIKTETNIKIFIDKDLNSIKAVDTLLFCGGAGVRPKYMDDEVIRQLQKLADEAGRLVSICTGSFLLAHLEIPKGVIMTTHWRYVEQMQKQYPNVEINLNAIYTQDGKVWSSAGVTSGIDLALAIIEEDLGSAIATGVARQLVVYAKRTGDQAQFSEPLDYSSVDVRLNKLISWILQNLQQELTLEKLSTQINLSPRQFSRVFKKNFKITPTKLIETLRLDKARILLVERKLQIEQIALAVGYNNADSFRRAFERKYSTTPALYQKQFSMVLYNA